jgi:transcriptional regulator with XRE-family HTH domain
MIYVGLKIRELMNKEKIDAPALAKRLNKSKQAVYDMLEKQDVSTSLLRELAVIFNVPITYFLTDGEEKPMPSQEEIDEMRQEIASLRMEVERLRALKLPTKDDKALDVSMKFFEAAKEMFSYYNQMKEE